MEKKLIDPEAYDAEFNPLGARADILCDGCNVREPHEHRCHGHNIVIHGVFTHQTCECDNPNCKELRR